MVLVEVEEGMEEEEEGEGTLGVCHWRYQYCSRGWRVLIQWCHLQEYWGLQHTSWLLYLQHWRWWLCGHSGCWLWLCVWLCCVWRGGQVWLFLSKQHTTGTRPQWLLLQWVNLHVLYSSLSSYFFSTRERCGDNWPWCCWYKWQYTFRRIMFGNSTFIFSVDVSLSTNGSWQKLSPPPKAIDVSWCL